MVVLDRGGYKLHVAQGRREGHVVEEEEEKEEVEGAGGLLESS